MKASVYGCSASGLTFLVLAELILRFGFGFGNPPLLIPHPTIEYLYKPSENYQLLGNQFLINEYGMRSDSFPATRKGNELRILVIGDSISNGGRRIDQSLLATELIKAYYAERLSVPVIVANISAASWSAPNQLAYLDEYGLFDADLAIIMQNAADIMIDYPSFVELHPIEQPTKAPLLALIEAYNKVIRPRIAPVLGLSQFREVFGEIPDGRTSCRLEIEQIVEKFHSNDIACMLVYHPSAIEITSGGEFSPLPNAFSILADISKQNDLPLVNIADEYTQSVQAGHRPFRDKYHPTALGQALIAEGVIRGIENSSYRASWEER